MCEHGLKHPQGNLAMEQASRGDQANPALASLGNVAKPFCLKNSFCHRNGITLLPPLTPYTPTNLKKNNEMN